MCLPAVRFVDADFTSLSPGPNTCLAEIGHESSNLENKASGGRARELNSYTGVSPVTL